MKKQHGLAGTPKVVSGTFVFSFVFVFPLLGSIACDTLCETPQGRGRPKKGGAGPVWGHGDGSTEVCNKIITAKQCKKYTIAFQYQTMSEGPSKGRPVGQVDKLKCWHKKSHCYC